MHCSNDNEMNSSAYHISSNTTPTPTPSTTTTASTSSSDSGVIITDNTSAYNYIQNDINNCNKQYINTKNTKNINNSHNHQQYAASVNATENSSNKNNKEMYNDNKLHYNNHINNSNINNHNNNNNNNTSDNTPNINIENILNISNAKSTQNCNVSIGIEDNDRRSVSKPSSKAGSPTVSIRSTSISIVSIDENAIDSSIIDSDSEYEHDAEGVHSNYIVKKLGQQTTYEPDNPNLHNINKGLTVISQSISPGAMAPRAGAMPGTVMNGGALVPPGVPLTPSTPQIGSIALTNSTDVTFGDKHFYEGPVTIQQFVIDSRDKAKAEGHDNHAFAGEGDAKANGQDGVIKGQQSQKQPHLLPFIFNRKAVIIMSIIITLMILVGVLFLTIGPRTNTKSKLPLGDGDDSRVHIPIHSTIAPDDSEYVFNGTLLIISKDQWRAKPEKDGVDKLVLPVHQVVIAHTATSICTDKTDCDERALSIQSFHMDSWGWGDIGYNFLIGGNGLVYEGRGWENQGAHTKGYNKDALGIAFIGTFNDKVPTKNELLACQLLIAEGVRRGALSEDYRLFGARQVQGTESPGKALYDIISRWPHWTRKP